FAIVFPPRRDLPQTSYLLAPASVACALARLTSRWGAFSGGSITAPSLRGFRLRLWLLNPARLHPRGDDEFLDLLPHQAERVEDAFMPNGLFILTALSPAGEVVSRAIGEVLDRFDVVLAERDHHRRGDAGHFPERVGDAKPLALGVKLGLDLFEMLASASLNFGGGVLVEAFDRCDLRRLDEGNLLDRAEAFRSEQLGNDLVDVERLHEGLRALGKLGLTPLRL